MTQNVLPEGGSPLRLEQSRLVGSLKRDLLTLVTAAFVATAGTADAIDGFDVASVGGEARVSTPIAPGCDQVRTVGNQSGTGGSAVCEQRRYDVALRTSADDYMTAHAGTFCIAPGAAQLSAYVGGSAISTLNDQAKGSGTASVHANLLLSQPSVLRLEIRLIRELVGDGSATVKSDGLVLRDQNSGAITYSRPLSLPPGYTRIEEVVDLVIPAGSFRLEAFVDGEVHARQSTAGWPYGGEHVSANWSVQVKASIVARPAGPVITGVTRQFPGVFLAGTTLENRFDVAVNWQGEPGLVEFKYAGKVLTQSGTATGVSQRLNMADFPPQLEPTKIEIVAINAAGQRGAPRIEEICVVPIPAWLEVANAVTNPAGEVNYSAKYETPHFGTDALIRIPAWVPFIGGYNGAKEFAGELGLNVSSVGKGSLEGSLALEFVCGDISVGIDLSAKAEAALQCSSGLTLTDGSIEATPAAKLELQADIRTVFPALRAAAANPIWGAAVRRFADLAQMTNTVEVSGQLAFGFATAEDGTIKYQGTGQIAEKLSSKLGFNIVPRLKASALVGGGGKVTVGVPDSFFRGLEVTFTAGLELTFDSIFGDFEGGTHTEDWTCKYLSAQVVCSKPEEGGEAVPSETQAVRRGFVIERDYLKFGKYAEFTVAKQEAGAHQSSKVQSVPAGNANSAADPSVSTLVSNLFPGASPVTIGLKDGGQLVLWVHADPDLPVTRGTGIMWSIQNTQGVWSQPQLVANDTRAEFSPVAAVDSNGNVVAAWLRVKDPDFPVSVSTTDDIARFYKSFEVVTADFDIASKAWGAVTTLTNDTALDTDLRLSSDRAGGLLLSWLSNEAAELVSTSTSPSALKFASRAENGWAQPGATTSLVGVSRHAAAVNGKEAMMIVSRDPDPSTANDEYLALYRRIGGAWTGPTTFAGGTVDNRLPVAAYDSRGIGHVVWQKGADLVSATLDNPTPRLVRPSNPDVGSYDMRLVPNAEGHLVLIHQQLGEEGVGNIFASVFDPHRTAWSIDHQLLQSPKQSADVSGYFDPKGDLRLVYVATHLLRTTRTVVIGGSTHVIENVPADGKSDLEAATVDGASLIPPAPPPPPPPRRHRRHHRRRHRRRHHHRYRYRHRLCS